MPQRTMALPVLFYSSPDVSNAVTFNNFDTRYDTDADASILHRRRPLSRSQCSHYRATSTWLHQHPAIYRKKIDLEQFRAVPDVPSSSEIIGRCERFDTMPANNDRPPAPPSFYCPLTMNLMKNPVQDREGNTYERYAIEQWLQSNHTSPITRNRQVSIATVSYVARRKCLTFVQAKKKAPSSQ